MAAGDGDAARKLLESVLAKQPGDEQALELMEYLEGTKADDLEAEREKVLGGPAGSIRPFLCLRCGKPCRSRGEFLVNTRWVTLFGFDELNAGAWVLECVECASMYWFGPSWPAFFQRRNRDQLAVSGDVPESGNPSCQVCGSSALSPGQGQINSRIMTFLGLDFLNQMAVYSRCLQCGHMHWWYKSMASYMAAGLRQIDPPEWDDVPAVVRDGGHLCLCCGSSSWSHREALLNHRVTTHLGLDWLDEGCHVLTCRECGSMAWVAGPIPVNVDSA